MSTLALLFALTGLAASPRAADESEPSVGLELLADVAALEPGASFALGVRFALPEHWHIYWENPGDTGLPTSVEIAAPEGFAVGEVLFPGPERFELPGDLVSYGYAREVLLIVPVTAPATLPEGPAAFRAAARWLVCKEACFLQQREVELALRPAPAGAAPAPEGGQRALFERWRERLPRPQAELAGLSGAWSRAESEAPELALRVPGARALAYFGHREDALEVREHAPGAQAEGALLKLVFDARALGATPVPGHARGVLRVEREAGVDFYEVRFARPASDAGAR